MNVKEDEKKSGWVIFEKRIEGILKLLDIKI